MGDLFRETGSLAAGQKNVGAAQFHALVEGLRLRPESITSKPALVGDGVGAQLLVFDPLTSTLRRATLNDLFAGVGVINADLLTTGTLPVERIADESLGNAKLGNDLDAGKLTAGTLPVERIADESIALIKLAAVALAELRDASELTGEIPAGALPDGGVVPGKVGVGTVTDFDLATQAGFWAWASEAENKPPALDSGVVIVLRRGADKITQFAIAEEVGKGLHWRTSANGGTSWGAWQATVTPAGIGFSALYQSAELTLPSAGNRRVAEHGLGGVPSLVEARLVCVTADLGYSPGESLLLATNDAANARGYVVDVSATEIGFKIRNGIRTVPRNSNSDADIATSRWRLVFRAWR